MVPAADINSIQLVLRRNGARAGAVDPPAAYSCRFRTGAEDASQEGKAVVGTRFREPAWGEIEDRGAPTCHGETHRHHPNLCGQGRRRGDQG